MRYPKLKDTPIKEIIFSISFEEILDRDCLDKFAKNPLIKEKFEANPIWTQSIRFTNGRKNEVVQNRGGYHFKNDSEILQVRTGSMSYHFLNKYQEYGAIVDELLKYWKLFDCLSKDDLTITSVSVRYINSLEADEENPTSRLTQIYPRLSSDRDVINFQNFVTFKFQNAPKFTVNVVSTKPNDEQVLLDITVFNPVDGDFNEINELFAPLREIKNRAFIDSITAQALIRYIEE